MLFHRLENWNWRDIHNAKANQQQKPNHTLALDIEINSKVISQNVPQTLKLLEEKISKFSLKRVSLYQKLTDLILPNLSVCSPKNTEKDTKNSRENICKSLNLTKDMCPKCTDSQNSTVTTQFFKRAKDADNSYYK